MELPIRRLLLGEETSKVINVDAMANPESLIWFKEFVATR